jgi:DNA-binding HxlR family transcriptional regulator
VSRDFCPQFQHAVELVGRRWCGAIARALLDGPLRFSELERAIPDISARALTQRLRELEDEGVVERLVEPSRPVRVQYALTEKGRALEEVVTGLERWADAWVQPARTSAQVAKAGSRTTS